MTNKINFDKLNGLVPAIIQDFASGKVLMLGFMNSEALEKSRDTGKVTFYSRTRDRLWTKGEESGNYLEIKNMFEDCDNDTLLIQAIPTGPVCHTGADTCFHDDPGSALTFISHLQKVIHKRKKSSPESSYTAKLFDKGKAKITQKVGEEAVECIIEAMKGDNERLKEEAADLLYHLMVLLASQNLSIEDVVKILKNRHK